MENYSSAIHIGIIAIKLNPFNLNILLDIAFAYQLDKEYESAIRCYQKVLEIEPENDEALANIGEIFYEKRDYRQSQEYLERLVALAPNFWRAWDYLARIYRHYGKHDMAQKARDIASYQLLSVPMIHKGYVIKKWIDKNNIPKIIIGQPRENVEYTITRYGKKDALEIYNSLEEYEIIEVFEDGRIYSLGKISRSSWDIKDAILDNLEIDHI